ncbi:MAG: diguanylate cyclase [Bdellovibrionales bacterium]|nr:diguanylate cyclase [Bdellovibrionales bacterium]
MIAGRKRKILLVDDRKENIVLLSEALNREGWDVRSATTGIQALVITEEWKPDLVILDQNMPGMSGLETLSQIKVKMIELDVMFVSGQTDSALIRAALDAGADDFLRRPFSMIELVSRVRVRFRIRDLRQELLEANLKLSDANVKLAELADHDDLTGLFNMRSLSKYLALELDKAYRSNSQVGCLMLDMDHFKNVNDDNDHLFGSYVLQCVGQILKDSVRAIDYPARYGGDEFLVIIVSAHFEGTLTLAERLRATISQSHFTQGKSKANLTASVGFALSPKGQKITPSNLIQVADHALYDAKNSGRNKIVGWNDSTVAEFLGLVAEGKKAS